MDWDLKLISARPFHRGQPRLFGLTMHCYVMILVDGLLRLGWVYKLILPLGYHELSSKELFVLHLFELIRRWMWLILRVETEALRKPDLSSYEL